MAVPMQSKWDKNAIKGLVWDINMTYQELGLKLRTKAVYSKNIEDHGPVAQMEEHSATD